MDLFPPSASLSWGSSALTWLCDIPWHALQSSEMWQRKCQCKGSLSPGSVTWPSEVLLCDWEIRLNKTLGAVDLRAWHCRDAWDSHIKSGEHTPERKSQDSRLCTGNRGDDSAWIAVFCQWPTVVNKGHSLEQTRTSPCLNEVSWYSKVFKLKTKLLHCRQNAPFKTRNWKALYRPNDQEEADY